VHVSFYSDAADPLHYACRLVRRARASGKPVGICAAAADLKRLDALLWSFEPVEFIPHRLGAEGRPGEVLLVERADALPHRGLLLNLGEEMPAEAERFERVLEVVGCDEAQKQAGRRRYRQYQALGAKLDHFSAAG
jgi:DNA polymerase-3 subunit chi